MILNLCLALAALLLLAAFFAVFETAFFSLSRPRLKQMTRGRPPEESAALAALLARPQELVTSVVLGVTLVHINVAVVGAVLLHEVLGARLGPRTFLLAESLVVTFVLLVLGEMAPKLFALAHAERTALQLARPMGWVARLLGPVSRLIARWLSLESRFGRAGHPGELVTVEELKTIVEAGSREGTLEPEERQLLQGAIRIGEVTAGEVMVRREDMVAVDAEADGDEVIETVREAWHSRIPVYQGTLERVVGIVHAKDLLPYLERGAGAVQVRELMRDATYVPASLPIDDVLRLLQRQHSQIAVVTDPEGRALGVATLEDVLEQLVGELAGEYAGEAPAVEVLEGGDAVVQARVDVRDVSRLLGLALPLDRGRTLGELLRNVVPGPPVEGESARVGGVELVLDSVVGGQIRAVRVVRTP
ncbi:MAG TPA: hemolysin family protein [Candidatus Saccharimonadales bacterium]|nr:hemolysin family protein [Candidatus Saccharimonadales bacterium]